MSRATYFRAFILSVLSALIFSAISLLALIRLSDMAASRHRDDFLLFLTESIERKIAGLSSEEIRSKVGQIHLDDHLGPMGPPRRSGDIHGGFRDMAPPPPPQFDRGPLLHPPPGGGPPRGPRIDLWLVEENGDIVFSEDNQPLEKSWAEIPRLDTIHEIVSKMEFFPMRGRTFAIRLDREPKLFLVVHERSLMLGPLFLTQASLTFGTVAIGLFFSLSLTFFYLRRKSLEARAVLLRLEKGDLKARFTIKRFDEFGGLLLDFNRMAEQIERLVSRIHASERARKELLQELGHDLRTPLTSLTTSFEMLQTHFGKMTEENRQELFEMIGAEVQYFKELLEKLMTIADLDEPHYKQSTQMIDLAELITQELKVRNSQSQLAWELRTDGKDFFFLGDSHLAMRLVKNALDNAARFAKARVLITLKQIEDSIELAVTDDGPGLTIEALDSFAKRRGQRTRREGTSLNFSLGLGSVIMKTIAELHGGTIQIENVLFQNEIRGAKLVIRLPKEKSTTPP